MHNFKGLLVWQKARILVSQTYLITQSYPDLERFGLISQMRRCAVSIASNIAEGYGRSTNKDFAHFISISLGSAFELETQLIVSFDINLIDKNKFEEIEKLISEVQRMLYSFRNKLKA